MAWGFRIKPGTHTRVDSQEKGRKVYNSQQQETQEDDSWEDRFDCDGW